MRNLNFKSDQIATIFDSLRIDDGKIMFDTCRPILMIDMNTKESLVFETVRLSYGNTDEDCGEDIQKGIIEYNEAIQHGGEGSDTIIGENTFHRIRIMLNVIAQILNDFEAKNQQVLIGLNEEKYGNENIFKHQFFTKHDVERLGILEDAIQNVGRLIETTEEQHGFQATLKSYISEEE